MCSERGDGISIQIRPYRAADYSAVRKILVEGGLFDRVWDRRSNLSRKTRYNARSVLVAVAESKVIGSVYISYDGWEGFIYRLAVLSDYRKQGVGTLLMRSAERELRKLGAKEVAIFVDAKNAGLQTYYKRRGYKLSKAWKSMWKKL